MVYIGMARYISHVRCFITRSEPTSGPLTLTPSLKGNKVVVGCGERLCSDPIRPVGRSQRYSYVTLERTHLSNQDTFSCPNKMLLHALETSSGPLVPSLHSPHGTIILQYFVLRYSIECWCCAVLMHST